MREKDVKKNSQANLSSEKKGLIIESGLKGSWKGEAMKFEKSGKLSWRKNAYEGKKVMVIIYC